MKPLSRINHRRFWIMVMMALLSWPVYMVSVLILARLGLPRGVCIMVPSPIVVIGFACAIFGPISHRGFRYWHITAASFLYILFGVGLRNLLL